MVVFPQIHRTIASDHPLGPLLTAALPIQALNSQEVHIQGQRQSSSLGSLTRDVYELTVDDAQMITEQISGRIWLTDTFENSLPFVTIQIS